MTTKVELFTDRRYFNDLRTKSGTFLECEVDIGYGIKIYAGSIGDKIYIAVGENKWSDGFFQYQNNKIKKESVDPFISVKPIGTIYHKKIIKNIYCKLNEDQVPTSRYSNPRMVYKDKEVLHTYDDKHNHSKDYYNHAIVGSGTPYNFLKLEITVNDGTVKEIEVCFRRPDTGSIDTSKIDVNNIPVSLDLFGTQLNWSFDILNKDNYNNNSDYKFFNILKKYKLSNSDEFWKLFLSQKNLSSIPTKAVKALEFSKKIAPNLSKLSTEYPLLYTFFLWLHNDKVKGGISNNQCLAAMLKKNGENYDDLKTQLRSVLDRANTIETSYYADDTTKQLCLLFDAAKTKDEEQRSHKEWYLKNTAGEQAEALGIDKKTYPLLWEAVSNNDIPIGVFHNPGDKLSIINVEFDLWEKALKRPRYADVLNKIAANAASRSTYERDMIPYISFLFKIERYLDKHAPQKGKHWKAIPAYVNSEWQLEMDEATEEGTVKKRSALTPVADNETMIVTVPYAAIAVHGRQTTYCYAKHYFVFEEYMLDDESGSIITKDLERKLNGRDDYGLMYYTLTGTPRNRGYPTFLIIFERLKEKTRVHFHRVHPNRYKEGKPTPACRLIEECYRYMAGNIRAEEIYAQQGDLIFIKCAEPEHSREELKSIKDFESHEFISFDPYDKEIPIQLYPNQTKSIKNRLGHIFCFYSFIVQHPEHDNLKMDAGWYEVRRCKSWEANPKAVWSYTID